MFLFISIYKCKINISIYKCKINRDATILLLQIYGEHENEFRNGKKTMKQYWEKIAKKCKKKATMWQGLNVQQNFKLLNDNINVFWNTIEKLEIIGKNENILR